MSERKVKVLGTAGLCCCISVLVWAQRAEAAANKVNICHYSADTASYHQLSVAASAVPGHLGHGDCVVDDGDPCTVDACDAATGCIHAAIICNDDNPCTDDVCNGGVCVYTPDDTNSCEDGVFCNGTAFCLDGGCVALSACPPIGDPCLVVTCDEENDECDITGKCDDGTFCTTDFCDPITGDCGYIDTCPAAIDPENCLVYGRCDEAAQTCPADPLEPCCGNGIVEAGEECESDADCPAGSDCLDDCTCFTPPSDDECFKEAPCSSAEVCTTDSGCQGACFFTAAGPTRCFDGEFGCDHPPCTTDADCAPGSACSDTCCGLQCTPLCAAPPPPPPVCENCFKEAVCAAPQVCTTADGCEGACYFTAAGDTCCFAGEVFCAGLLPCASDSDCPAGSACASNCCGLVCVPVCGSPFPAGAAANQGAPSSSTSAAAAAPGDLNRTGSIGSK